jgi:hypothetical protein
MIRFRTNNVEDSSRLTISNPKSSNIPLFSNRKEAKNRSMGIESGSFGAYDPEGV